MMEVSCDLIRTVWSLRGSLRIILGIERNSYSGLRSYSLQTTTFLVQCTRGLASNARLAMFIMIYMEGVLNLEEESSGR